MALHTGSSLSEPPSAMQLDTAALAAYLATRVPGVLTGHADSRSIQVKQFSHGQSNPTYLLTGQLNKPLVLRKKPPGRILPSAHSIEREYQVLDALSRGSKVAVPRPVALCEDSSIVGTPFYLMEFAEGDIFLDANLPGVMPAVRRSIYKQMAECLAALHATDVGATGLQDYGKAQDYCKRQLRRWTAQYQASVSSTPAEVTQLIEWLNQHIPAEDAAPPRPQPGGTQPVLVAVLDWELSTVGNRWADVAYNCLPYHLPDNMRVLKRLGGPAGLPQGIPTEQEYLAMYCTAAGVAPPPAKDWSFFLALSLFRLLAILAGVQARAKQGNASSKIAAAVSSDQVLLALTQAALRIISTSSSDPPVAPAPRSGSSSQSPAEASAPVPPHVSSLLQRLRSFMVQHVYPAEEVLEAHAAGPDRWTVHPRMEQMKTQAKEAGLWNLWLPGPLADRLQHLLPHASSPLNKQVLLGSRLSHWEYAHLCELMGRSVWAPEVFNCGAPDTGNMEVLAKYGSAEQQIRWLVPLLQGDIRSCFAMTEKAVASSDATNIQSSIKRQGDSYVLSGTKWWTSGACDPRCEVAIFMGKTDTAAAQHLQQSMVIVPFKSAGVKVVRPMLVFGYDDAPHGHAEVVFDSVKVPAANLILGEGRGFEIAQGRLGPGRLHHCMRLIGLAERAMDLMATRAQQRTVFGRQLAQQGAFQAELARCRVDLDASRLLVLHASATIDRAGNKAARGAVAAAKVNAPNMAQRVVDAAIQAHGAAGVSQDTVLARLWTAARTLRIADGPDEVHLGTIAKLELARAAKL